jgi:HSP20 family protein
MLAPFVDIQRTFAEIDRLFHTPLAAPVPAGPRPGATAADAQLSLEGRRLDLRVARKSEAPEGFRPLRVEREPALLERSILLPDDVDADHIEARVRNGILVLTLPRRAAPGRRAIPVSAG